MNSVSKLPGVIIVVAVIAIIYCFNSMKTVEEEIATAESDKAVLDKQLERYADIDKYYGRASDDFYADKPIVVLRGKGATEVVRVYRSNKSFLTAGINATALEGVWGDDDKTWVNYSITSKITHGYEPVIFKNNDSNEKFTILVIVK